MVYHNTVVRRWMTQRPDARTLEETGTPTQPCVCMANSINSGTTIHSYTCTCMCSAAINTSIMHHNAELTYRIVTDKSDLFLSVCTCPWREDGRRRDRIIQVRSSGCY